VSPAINQRASTAWDAFGKLTGRQGKLAGQYLDYTRNRNFTVGCKAQDRKHKCPSENILNPLNHLWFKVVT